MGNPHILAIPYPAQGHVIPLMELGLGLAKQGFKVTFVNTTFIHKRVMNAFSKEDKVEELINMVSILDGIEPWEDRNDPGKLSETIFRVMPGKLEELIEKINTTDNDKITSVITDGNMGWALEVAEKIGIRRAAFWPAASAMLAFIFKIPELIQNKVIDNDGIILKSQMINLSPNMPTMNTNHFPWACIGDSNTRKLIFKLLEDINRTVKLTKWIICNTAYELEPAASTSFPEILPIGPLLASNWLGKSAGYFWSGDSTCLKWLDQQRSQSVIYVAFGSFTIFDQAQFQELALGLELTNRPFLWVVRPDMTDDTTDVFLEEFQSKIGTRGRVVGWAPQQQVLDHLSVGCFFSHCGWNSTMEGISNEVPFLCWPYFADQFLNETYICDVWKVRLGFTKIESGIITNGEIKNKVEQILNKTFRTTALVLKEKAINSVRKGGCSNKNMSNFIEWLK